jgi:SAM-dependent methyltransferase
VFNEEALWIRAALESMPLGPDSVILDVGSATEYYRRVVQPFIDFEIFRPLRARGAQIVHVDTKDDDGVDVVVDVTSPADEERWTALPSADVVLCCNMLEHVVDRDLVCRRVIDRTRPGGFLIVTVPHKYRYHNDPIDTMYRPTLAELKSLFDRDGLVVLHEEMVDVHEVNTSQPERGEWVPTERWRPDLPRRAVRRYALAATPVVAANKALRLGKSSCRLEIAEHHENQVALLAMQRTAPTY